MIPLNSQFKMWGRLSRRPATSNEIGRRSAETKLLHRQISELGLAELALLAASVLSGGCAGRNVTADNPVVGLIPPRVAQADDSRESQTVHAAEADGDTVQQTAFEDGSSVPQLDREMLDVAAKVDGTPILVSDILEPYAVNLAAARKQLPDAKYLELRNELIRRDLPRFIDEAVLMNAALVKLDADKKAKLEEQLDQFFMQELKAIQEKSGAATIPELEAKMQAQGTTLSSLRRAFGRRQLAQQSLMMQLGQEPSATRAELLAEYEKRIDSYKLPAQVKWQQIWVSYAKHGGKEQALAVLEQAISELKSGADFGDVSRKYSDGVMASKGGQWDWTRKGSLANAELERLLFEINVGEIGPVITEPKALQIVRVTERLPDRVTPFEEVQNQLREEIISQKQLKMKEDVVKRLRKDAVITTMFDAE